VSSPHQRPRVGANEVAATEADTASAGDVERDSDVGGNVLAGALSYRLFVFAVLLGTSPSRTTDCWPAPWASRRRAYVGASASRNGQPSSLAIRSPCVCHW
jgi:hypothetical protein